MRNVCNQKYSNECILPIMSLVFPIVNDVRVVRLTDADLEAIVEANNSHVTTPFAADEIMPFVHLNKFCLDLHPDIDGFIKSLAAVRQEICVQPDSSTREYFTNCYHLCWTVMESTCVLSRGGGGFTGPG